MPQGSSTDRITNKEDVVKAQESGKTNIFYFIPSVYDKGNFANFVRKTAEEGGALYIKEKDSDIWGPLQSRPRHNQSPVNIVRTKEDVVKANKSAPTNIPGVPGHKGLKYNLADLDKFVKRKIAKYNNYVST